MKGLFTLLSILLLVGCTVTKRHFGSGYHVEWKKSYSKTGNESEKLNLVDLRDNSPEEAEIQLESTISPIDSTLLKNESLVDELFTRETTTKEIIASKPIDVTPQKIQKKPLQEKDQPIDEVKRKTEPLTWVSLILFFIAGIALGIIGSYGSILFVGSGILITCLMIAMFVCSLISVIRIRRYPDRYKNKGLTGFLFSFSIICLITAIIYLIGISALASMSLMLQGI